MAVEGESAHRRCGAHQLLRRLCASPTAPAPSPGMLTDGLGLFGGTIIFIFLGPAAPDALLGFGFGGTLLAPLHAWAAASTPRRPTSGRTWWARWSRAEEDDPRNAAVIADLVGDSVGDCAGMAADIFESYEVTIVSALILGLALVAITGRYGADRLPLVVRGIGVLSSIVGTYLVRAREGEGSGDAMGAIFRGFLVGRHPVVLFAGVGFLYLQNVPGGWWRPVLAVTVGVVLAILIDP